MGAVAIVILLGFIYLPSDALVGRFQDVAHTENISSDIRVQIWRDSARLIKDYPLFGCGLGDFGSCFLRYKDVAPMFTVDYAHNDYLQVLAEFGIFGFAAGLILVGAVLSRAVRGALNARSGDERFISIACLGAMIAMLLHSLVDFNMNVPANAFEFAWIFGIAAAYTTSSSRKKIERVRERPPFRTHHQHAVISALQ